MNDACGKIILFGEHAVVFGKPGIAVPITNLKTTVEIELSDTFSYSVDRVLYEEEKDRLADILDIIFFSLDIEEKDIHISIKSTLPISSGMGSSAALSIAIIRAASDFYRLKLNDEKVNEVALECEKYFHGKPSGIDNTVITYEKPILYKDGEPDFLEIKPFTLMIADTGDKASTKKQVMKVKENYDKNKEIIEKIGKVSQDAKLALEKADFKTVGTLMNKNHLLLKELGVSTKKLDLLVETAIGAGALGAKLAGSGGGGNIIALVDGKNKEEVKTALEAFSKAVYVGEIK